MKRAFIPAALALALLLCLGAALAAGGDAGDPLLSLSYLTEQFSKTADAAVEARLDAADSSLRESLEDKSLKVPHMGWNSLHVLRGDPLFRYVKSGEYVYYVHSFYARNCDASTLVTSRDVNVAVTGAVRRGNVWGTQFHPEKSGDAGLGLLRAFAEL